MERVGDRNLSPGLTANNIEFESDELVSEPWPPLRHRWRATTLGLILPKIPMCSVDVLAREVYNDLQLAEYIQQSYVNALVFLLLRYTLPLQCMNVECPNP
jgi:hypothetical protein